MNHQTCRLGRWVPIPKSSTAPGRQGNDLQEQIEEGYSEANPTRKFKHIEKATTANEELTVEEHDANIAVEDEEKGISRFTAVP